MKGKDILCALGTAALCGVLVWCLNHGLGPMALERRQRAELELMRLLLPGSGTFAEEPYSGEDGHIRAVWKGENGWVVESGAWGYADDVVLWVGVDGSGTVTGLVVRSLHETYGLGAGALYDTDFLSQYLGAAGGLMVGAEVDALTGATVTSKAVTKAVNSACAYVTGVDVDSAATEWGG